MAVFFSGVDKPFQKQNELFIESFIGLFNFSKGSQLIFHDALGFFVIHECFFNDSVRLLVVKIVFSMTVLVFWLQAVCNTVLWAFFFSLDLTGLSPNQGLAKS